MVIGSRVRVLRHEDDAGKTGKVVAVCSTGQCYRVQLDEGGDTVHYYMDTEDEGLEEIVDLEVDLALAGLEGRLRDDEQVLRDVEQLVTTARARTLETRSLLEKTKAALDLPPFRKGQTVKVLKGRAKGVRVSVVAVEKAFGEWQVQVAFPGESEPYTYPARTLEVA